MLDKWQDFADFLEDETGEEIPVRDLKLIVERAVADRQMRKTIETGGNALLDSVFVEPVIDSE